MDLEFRDKIAVVTGGSSGIGRSISTKLAEAGATVIMIARDKAKGESTRQQIAAIGGRSEFLSVDLRDYDAVQAAISEIDQKYGALNILINCAGGTAGKLGMDDSTSPRSSTHLFQRIPGELGPVLGVFPAAAGISLLAPGF